MSNILDDDWGQVATNNGEYARMDALTGHLLVIFPIGYIEHSQTRFTTPGKKSDVIICDIIDLDDADENGIPGKLYRTQWWRGAVLIAGLRPRIGSKILGRLGKGIAKNGMNQPWVVTDMVSDEDCLNRARAWGRAHDNFEPSQFQPPVPMAPQDQYYPPQGQQPQPQSPQQQSYPAQRQQPQYPPQGQQPQYPAPQPPQPQYPPQEPAYGPGPGTYAGNSGNGYQDPGPQSTYPSGAPPQAPRYPVPTAPPSPEDMRMLEAMRQARQQQTYSDEPPF